MPTLIAERVPLVVDEAGTAKTGRRLLVQVITPGWGSSGYYGADVLEQAGKDRVFKAGTHVYLDHPTESEKWERPARSLRDLAGILTSDARWNGSALVAEVEVFDPFRAAILDMRDAIGMSIRASAEGSSGKAEGRTGPIITRLIEAQSVDFVTKAGRGGRILSVLESALEEARGLDVSEGRNLGQWLESRIHQSFTNMADDLAADGHLTREERIALSSAIGDALATFASKVETEQPHLYDRDPFADPTAPPAVAEDVPVARPGSNTTTTESHEENQMGQKQIEESEFTRLTEAAGRVETLEAEKKAWEAEKTTFEADLTKVQGELAEAKKELAEAQANVRPSVRLMQEQMDGLKAENAGLRASIEAAPIVAEGVAEALVSDTTKARIQAKVLADLPLSEGKLDRTKLAQAITDQVNEAETEAAELLKAAGVGSPRGLGALTTPATEAASEQFVAATESAIGEAFSLSESAVKTAVKGR